MTDKIFVSRSEIEALFKSYRASNKDNGWTGVLIAELVALLDKAAISQLEPVGEYEIVDGKFIMYPEEIKNNNIEYAHGLLYTSPPADNQDAENWRSLIEGITLSEEVSGTRLMMEHREIDRKRIIKDAERYRWLKLQNADLDNDSFVVLSHDCTAEEVYVKYWVGSDLDEAIDAAMQKGE